MLNSTRSIDIRTSIQIAMFKRIAARPIYLKRTIKIENSGGSFIEIAQFRSRCKFKGQSQFRVHVHSKLDVKRPATSSHALLTDTLQNKSSAKFHFETIRVNPRIDLT